jgi:hypothetical protein
VARTSFLEASPSRHDAETTSEKGFPFKLLRSHPEALNGFYNDR